MAPEIDPSPGGGDPIEFVVPGIPVPKGRPRVSRKGWAYTPKRTLEYQERVKTYGILRRNALKLSILGGYFRLDVVFYGARGNSDVDNLYKSVADALEGVFYRNDAQIVACSASKAKCPKGEERTEVSLKVVV